MKNEETVLVKREIATHGLPKKNGKYHTNAGVFEYNVESDSWMDDEYFDREPTHWYEEVPLSELMEEENVFNIDFIKWYSGMKEETILKAYKRWKNEAQPPI
jgi:hypothetical protein